MKKITDLKLVDWQQYLDQFVCEKPNKSDSPVTRRGPTHGRSRLFSNENRSEVSSIGSSSS